MSLDLGHWGQTLTYQHWREEMKIWFSRAVVLGVTFCAGLGSISCTPSEAKVEAQKYWEKRLTKCGDYHWARITGGVAVYKDFDYTVRNLYVKETDRTLNKVEWRVQTEVKSGTPCRVWNPLYKTWDTDWRNAYIDPARLSPGAIGTQIDRKNGRVRYGPNDAEVFHPERLDCSSLPTP